MPTLIKIDTLKKCIKLSYFVYGYSNAYFYSFEPRRLSVHSKVAKSILCCHENIGI